MRTCILLVMILVLAPVLGATDYLRTTDGDVLAGKFTKLEGGKVFFESDSLGAVQVAIEKVAELRLADEREARIREGDDIQEQQEVRLTVRGERVLVEQNGVRREIPLRNLRGINEAMPKPAEPEKPRPRWDLTARAFFTWTEGNRENIALGYRFDIRRKSPINEIRLFGQGQYLQDRELERDSVRQRNFAVGFRYSYISSFKLAVDLTNDTAWDEIRGFRVRNTTGLGASYFIVDKEAHTLRVALAGTWTYEDNIRGAEDRTYFGARGTVEGEHWVADRTLRVRYKSEFLMDFEEFDNHRANSELLVEVRFLEYFTFGVVTKHTWQNMPPVNNVRNDLEVTATLGFTWGGPGP